MDPTLIYLVIGIIFYGVVAWACYDLGKKRGFIKAAEEYESLNQYNLTVEAQIREMIEIAVRDGKYHVGPFYINKCVEQGENPQK